MKSIVDNFIFIVCIAYLGVYSYQHWNTIESWGEASIERITKEIQCGLKQL